MKDAQLYKQIMTFCIEATDFIAKNVVSSNMDIPSRIAENFSVLDDHTISQEQSVEIDWNRLVIQKWDQLEELSSCQTAIKSLETHSVIGPQMNSLIGSGGTARRVESVDLLRIILGFLLTEKKQAIFDESFFKSIYEKIEKFFYAETFHYRYLAPISNFSMDVQEIILGDNLKIIKISKEDKERLLSTSNSFNSTYPLLASKEYTFEFLHNQKKVVGENPSPSVEEPLPEGVARALFNEVCSALRLYKEGLIGINHIWTINQDWDFFGTSFHFTLKGPTEFYGNKMMLSSQEIPDFLKLFTKYGNITAKNRRKVINDITRLGFGTERTRPEDQIVDYFIGLEGLFLSDNNPELKYRLALSVAHWLGKDFEDRKKIYSVISKGYDQRSNIVHGGEAKSVINIDGSITSIADHTQLIENYLRQAAKKFVDLCSDQNMSEEQLLIELRDEILN